MQKLLTEIDEFRKKRDWHLVDTPANLSRSIIIEAAELLEHFQWDDHNYNQALVESELADVLMYALTMCLELNVDPKNIIQAKMLDVAKRYPEKNG